MVPQVVVHAAVIFEAHDLVVRDLDSAALARASVRAIVPHDAAHNLVDPVQSTTRTAGGRIAAVHGARTRALIRKFLDKVCEIDEVLVWPEFIAWRGHVTKDDAFLTARGDTFHKVTGRVWQIFEQGQTFAEQGHPCVVDESDQCDDDHPREQPDPRGQALPSQDRQILLQERCLEPDEQGVAGLMKGRGGHRAGKCSTAHTAHTLARQFAQF